MKFKTERNNDDEDSFFFVIEFINEIDKKIYSQKIAYQLKTLDKIAELNLKYLSTIVRLQDKIRKKENKNIRQLFNELQNLKKNIYYIFSNLEGLFSSEILFFINNEKVEELDFFDELSKEAE